MKLWVLPFNRRDILLRKYHLFINEKPFLVELKKHIESSFSIQVNQKPYNVKIKEVDYKTPFSVEIQKESYKIELKKIDKFTFIIKINNIPLRVNLESTIQKSSSAVSEPSQPVFNKSASKFKEGEITAPMAGKIVSVNVKEGDSVKSGHVLCVLEAMKMENEITTPKSGVVCEIRISEGVTVNEGTVLIIVKDL